MKLRPLLLALLCLLAGAVSAHEVRPAYLELRQTGAETYDVLWKVPALDEGTVLKLKPVFPQRTLEVTPQRSAYADGATGATRIVPPVAYTTHTTTTTSTALYEAVLVWHDEDGRLWTSAADGVHCYLPDGTLIGRIRVPEVVANVCFGQLRRNRLYICGTTSLYAYYLLVRGAKTF